MYRVAVTTTERLKYPIVFENVEDLAKYAGCDVRRLYGESDVKPPLPPGTQLIESIRRLFARRARRPRVEERSKDVVAGAGAGAGAGASIGASFGTEVVTGSSVTKPSRRLATPGKSRIVVSIAAVVANFIAYTKINPAKVANRSVEHLELDSGAVVTSFQLDREIDLTTIALPRKKGGLGVCAKDFMSGGGLVPLVAVLLWKRQWTPAIWRSVGVEVRDEFELNRAKESCTQGLQVGLF